MSYHLNLAIPYHLHFLRTAFLLSVLLVARLVLLKASPNVAQASTEAAKSGAVNFLNFLKY